jgi:hypothetical protein
VANFMNMFGEPKAKKMKRHVDARDDLICVRFMKADELKTIAVQPLLRKGNQADRNRLDSAETIINNRVLKRYLIV